MGKALKKFAGINYKSAMNSFNKVTGTKKDYLIRKLTNKKNGIINSREVATHRANGTNPLGGKAGIIGAARVEAAKMKYPRKATSLF